MDKNAMGIYSLLENVPELQFLSSHKQPSKDSLTGVYDVLYNGKTIIAKLAPKFDSFSCGQVDTESEVLSFIDGQLGTPKLIKYFDLGDFVAILKEKVDGEFIENWKGKGFYKPAKEVIEAYHSLGVSGLDVSGAPRNFIIVDYDNKIVKPIDFGLASLKTTNPDEFYINSRHDLMYLDDVFRK